MHLVQIPPTAAQNVWPLAASFLAKSIEMSNGWTSAERELQSIASEAKQLWMVVVEEDGKNKAVAAGITSIQPNADGSKTANIEFFGGQNMKVWFSLSDDFEEWARNEGCRDIRLWARKAWIKHLKDYSLTHYMMRKIL